MRKTKLINKNLSIYKKSMAAIFIISALLSGCSNRSSETKISKTGNNTTADIYDSKRIIESCNLSQINKIWLNSEYTDLEKKKTFPGVVLSAYLSHGSGEPELLKLQNLAKEKSNLEKKLSSFGDMKKFYILGSIDNLGSLNLFYYKARLAGNENNFLVATRNNLIDSNFYYEKEFCSDRLKLFDVFNERKRFCDNNGCEELTKPVTVYKASGVASCNISNIRNKLAQDRSELTKEIKTLTHTYAYLLAMNQLHKNSVTQGCKVAWNDASVNYKAFQVKLGKNYYSTIGNNIAENGIVRYTLKNPIFILFPTDSNIIPIRFGGNKITYLKTSPKDGSQFSLDVKTPCVVGSTSSEYSYWNGIRSSLLKKINHDNPMFKNYKSTIRGKFNPTTIFLGINSKAAKFCVYKSNNPQVIFKHFDKSAMPTVSNKSCKVVYSAYYEHGKELKRQLAGKKISDQDLSSLQLREYRDLPKFNYNEFQSVVNRISSGTDYTDNKYGVFQGIANTAKNSRKFSDGKYGFPYFSDKVCQSQHNEKLYNKFSKKTNLLLKNDFISNSGGQHLDSIQGNSILNMDSLSCAKYYQNASEFKNSNYKSCIIKKTNNYLGILSMSTYEKSSAIAESDTGNKLIYEQRRLLKKLVRYGIVPRYSFKVPLFFNQYGGGCLLKADKGRYYVKGYLMAYNLQACKDHVLLKGLDYLKNLLTKNSGKVKSNSSYISNKKSELYQPQKNFPIMITHSILINRLRVYVRNSKYGVLITRVVSKHNELLGLHKGEVIYNVIYDHDNSHFVKNVSQLIKLVNSLHYQNIFIEVRIGEGTPHNGYGDINLFVK